MIAFLHATKAESQTSRHQKDLCHHTSRRPRYPVRPQHFDPEHSPQRVQADEVLASDGDPVCSQNRVRENEVNGAPLRWGLPGCSSGGHQSKVLITRPLCFGALAEAEPDASSNVRFFLSDLVSQASCWKVQEASSALGSIRPTLMQVSKPNTSANSCDMPC